MVSSSQSLSGGTNETTSRPVCLQPRDHFLKQHDPGPGQR